LQRKLIVCDGDLAVFLQSTSTSALTSAEQPATLLVKQSANQPAHLRAMRAPRLPTAVVLE
jgi:hypothetical protein